MRLYQAAALPIYFLDEIKKPHFVWQDGKSLLDLAKGIKYAVGRIRAARTFRRGLINVFLNSGW
ncbi:hypothetical protein AAE02nite_24760 [Adhaeribacter aerolatus]|uniref:Uncharacterized protein n=1 Tax=Adhaeribacter aerolatus TaxID=670289 RepID=A0A512AYK9_9BACT|nr:hypothetical protein AAE02nite_24760 [Adhaeribacter aerolatus]